MTPTDLATLIGTSAAWIKRALRADPAARKVRTRLATALTAEQAQALGLAKEHQIAADFRAFQQQIEASLLAAEERVEKHPTTLGIVRLIQHPFLCTP